MRMIDKQNNQIVIAKNEKANQLRTERTCLFFTGIFFFIHSFIPKAVSIANKGTIIRIDHHKLNSVIYSKTSHRIMKILINQWGEKIRSSFINFYLHLSRFFGLPRIRNLQGNRKRQACCLRIVSSR